MTTWKRGPWHDEPSGYYWVIVANEVKARCSWISNGAYFNCDWYTPAITPQSPGEYLCGAIRLERGVEPIVLAEAVDLLLEACAIVTRALAGMPGAKPSPPPADDAERDPERYEHRGQVGQ